jgi:hypothetical protein
MRLGLGGHDDSPAARGLCRGLTVAGLGPFEIDYQVTDEDGVMLVDVAWPPKMFGLEYNGRRDHDGRLARAADARRRMRLAALGWQILDVDCTMRLDDVVRWVRAALAATPTRV